jgi:membrane protease subunit HflC
MKKGTILIIIIVAILILLNSSLFIIDETKQGVVLQFGKPIRVIRDSGLNFKLPFIQNVVYFEDRLLVYDAAPTEIITKDKKTLIVDNYARWKIIDPLKFLQTVRDINGAQARLDDIIYSELRVDLGLYEMSEIVSEKREVIMEKVTKISNEKAKSYGIGITDVRIKRVDLPLENEKYVFNRMEAERERIAKQYRAEGQEESAKIMAETEKQKTIILAEAYKTAQVLKGEGEAEAVKIYAKSFNQDPEFYKFFRTLEAYKNSLKDKTTILFSSESEFLKYLSKPR